MRLIDLILVVLVWSTLKNQENRKAKNCLSLKNQKVKNWLSLKNRQKNKNLFKFHTKKIELNFLILDAWKIFNCL